MDNIKKIIFIRRDNIGDLVCTTPAIRAIRLKYPRAKIGVFVNSYNADVLRDNPDVDEIYAYEKFKHSGGKNRVRVWLNSLKVIRRVRAGKYDAAVGCGSYSPTLARYTFLTGAKLRIGYVPEDKSQKFYNHPLIEHRDPMHEVEATMGLLEPLGIEGPIPSLCVRPSGELKESLYINLRKNGLEEREKIVIFHISSRRPENRWPKEMFMELGDRIHEKKGLRVLLLWSPGKVDNPLHPGDDSKAEWIIYSMKKRPLFLRTESLKELIAAMALGDLTVCCDGGAMHIAAGLGKPILTIWGSTDKRRWAPWGVPNIILQKGDDAASIDAASAFSALKELLPGL